jgi:hypothetical protein
MIWLTEAREVEDYGQYAATWLQPLWWSSQNDRFQAQNARKLAVDMERYRPPPSAIIIRESRHYARSRCLHWERAGSRRTSAVPTPDRALPQLGPAAERARSTFPIHFDERPLADLPVVGCGLAGCDLAVAAGRRLAGLSEHGNAPGEREADSLSRIARVGQPGPNKGIMVESEHGRCPVRQCG